MLRPRTLQEVTAVPKAPAKSLPPPRRAFEPARYAQRCLACAYSQLLPTPRRRVEAPAAPAAPAARAGVAS